MEPNNTKPAPKKTNKVFVIILILLVIAGGWFGISKYIHGQHHEETDDAQVEANISPVIPRISGYVTQVRVKDNQKVKKGEAALRSFSFLHSQLLTRLDFHHHRQHHRPALGLAIQEIADCVLDLAGNKGAVGLGLAVAHMAFKRIANRALGRLDQVIRLTHVDEAARDHIRP